MYRPYLTIAGFHEINLGFAAHMLDRFVVPPRDDGLVCEHLLLYLLTDIL